MKMPYIYLLGIVMLAYVSSSVGSWPQYEENMEKDMNHLQSLGKGDLRNIGTFENQNSVRKLYSVSAEISPFVNNLKGFSVKDIVKLLEQNGDIHFPTPERTTDINDINNAIKQSTGNNLNKWNSYTSNSQFNSVQAIGDRARAGKQMGKLYQTLVTRKRTDICDDITADHLRELLYSGRLCHYKVKPVRFGLQGKK